MRGKPYFTVRGAIAGSAVRCYFGERKEIALAVAGKRIVSVDGTLHRDPDGRPQRISSVRSFAVTGERWPGEWSRPPASRTRRSTCGISVASDPCAAEPDANPGFVYLIGDGDWHGTLHAIAGRGGACAAYAVCVWCARWPRARWRPREDSNLRPPD